MRKRSVLFAIGALMLVARPSSAGEPEWLKVFISPGAIASWSFTPDTASGAGFEVSAGYIFAEHVKSFPHVGGLYRVQDYNTGPWGHYGRHTIALEGGFYFFGVELGWAFRDGFPIPIAAANATSGVHISPYLSFGLIYFGPQFLIPVTTSGDVEVALNLGFKFPLPQIVALPAMAIGMAGMGGNWGAGGRPLRIAGEQKGPGVRRGRGWRRGRSPRIDHLDAHTRSLLAAHWANEARAEHASIATFAKLTLELLAVSAPASLVRRAQRAASDEIRHAELCFRLASTYAGEEIEPSPIDATIVVRKPSLTRMAREAFIDGVIGEGVAAAIAKATETDDPVVAAALRRIARDETRHAALGRDIVAWCAKKGGAKVRSAIDRARRATFA